MANNITSLLVTPICCFSALALTACSKIGKDMGMAQAFSVDQEFIQPTDLLSKVTDLLSKQQGLPIEKVSVNQQKILAIQKYFLDQQKDLFNKQSTKQKDLIDQQPKDLLLTQQLTQPKNLIDQQDILLLEQEYLLIKQVDFLGQPQDSSMQQKVFANQQEVLLNQKNVSLNQKKVSAHHEQISIYQVNVLLDKEKKEVLLKNEKVSVTQPKDLLPQSDGCSVILDNDFAQPNVLPMPLDDSFNQLKLVDDFSSPLNIGTTSNRANVLNDCTCSGACACPNFYSTS